MATAPKTTTDTSVAALSAALSAPLVEKDEFSDAFASFADPTTPPATTTEATAQATQEGQDGQETTATADEPASEIEGAPDAAQEGAEGEQKTPEQIAAEAAEAAKAAKPATTTDDAIARLADAIAQRNQPQDKAPPAPQVVQPQPLYSADEVAQIQNFYKEWPEVAPAVETLLKGAITATENRIYAEVARVIGPKLKVLDQLADQAVYSQIKQAVPDYDETLEDKVSAWVKTQPAYLQDAYTNVMQKGTADDITDLVNRFRRETGTAAPSGDRTTQAQQAPAPTKQAASLSPVAKKAAAALAPVTSKRTGSTQVEPQTFDEAFDVFAKAG